MKFWKRVMAAVTAGLLCVGSVPVMQTVLPEVEITASAETYGDLSYSVLDDGTIEITDCDETAAEVEIPAEIDGITVTSIGYKAFYSCDKLTSIIIPDGVTSIGHDAFEACTNLISIDIPNSVTSIDNYAFFECYRLASISIPDNVTSIGGGAFEDCTSLTSITIPDSVTTIGNGAFCHCTSLTSFSVSDNNTSYCCIDGVLFNKDQTELISYPNEKSSTYIIPDGVSSVGSSAFKGCDNLTSITIPNSVTSIGRSAFESCTSLTSITIPNSVTSIHEAMFFGCYNLTSITIPDNVTNIDNLAFYECYKLTSITIPDSVTSIGNRAFACCTSLTAIAIPDSVTEVGLGMFYGCSKLQSVTLSNQITELLSSDIHGFFQNCSSLTEIVIPDGVTRIEYNAFSNCTALTTITLPATLTNIGDNAFEACDNLTDVYYGGSEASWNERTWSVKSEEPLLNANIHYNLTYRILEDDTAEVVSCAKDAAQVTIPEKAYGVPVTSIAKSAFADCNLIKVLVIPDGITAIRSNTFSNCTQLAEITIPDSVTSIDASAFSACTSLSDVYYAGTMAQWQTITIAEEGNESLSYATIHCSDGDIILTYRLLDDGTAEVASCVKSATQVTIPEKVYDVPVTSIAESAFADCTQLAEITIPDSMTSIDALAFSACSSLSDVYYTGTIAQWQTIAISEEGNESLSYATIHCSDGDIIPEIQSGDIDGDNTIDADDAYFCLLAYAKMSLNQNSGLTDAQVKAADVDGDGSITANDAYYILLYYAKKSVGQDVTWEEIL